jgi:uncharacterized protein (TIGR02145 family)
MKTMKILTLIILTFILGKANGQTITDYDGNIYPVITIGSQKWMGRNLRVTHFNDGSPINNAGYTNWYYFPLNEPRYCEPVIPPNTTDTMALGFWYNYPAGGDPRNICPQGWHVATDADWYQLVHHLDPTSDTSSLSTLESSIVGGMLKDTITWTTPNLGATNSTGFSALAVSQISGSIIWPSGYVCCQGMNASFWCGGIPWTPGVICYDRYLNYMNASIARNSDNYSNGKSIRCVCDTLSVTSIEKDYSHSQLKIYPNPASDRITVTAMNKSLGRIIIKNNLGVIIYNSQANESTKIIDVSYLTNGAYFIVLPDLNTSSKILIIK